MRHYVLAMDRRNLVLVHFSAFSDSEVALQMRFEIERELGLRNVVAIGAPDLHTLIRHHGRYFFGIVTDSINDCFFCRSYLFESIISKISVEGLVDEASTQGHCLFCHQSYPRTGIGITEAMLMHTPECAVLFDLG
jgi:hypothetical protein